jgi:2-dehydropantoate 2-reductase
MKIAIVGAGGVGGYYGGLLAHHGHDVVMLARPGAHLEALAARGIEVRTPEGTFTAAVGATADPRAIGAVDFAILAVKAYSLPGVVPAVRLLAEAGATILPLLNGVEVADHLAAAGVPAARILGGLTQISVVRIAPGVVERRSPFQSVVVGELPGAGTGGGDRAARIVAALLEAGVTARVSADITADLWRKLAFIAAMAAVCGLARAPVGAVRAAPLGKLLFERAVGEVVAVGMARGVALAADEAEKVLRSIESLPEATRPSFLLDLLAGGPTELDDLSGAISRFGRLAGVETPVHDTAVAALGARAGQGAAPSGGPGSDG